MATVPDKQAQESDERELHYFLPSQFLLLVEHDGGLEAGMVQEFISSFDMGGLKQYVDEARIEQARILTFDQQEGRFEYFSLVPIDLPKGISDNDLIELIERLYAQCRRRRNDRLVVRSATPNWLSSSAPPGQMVTGGPGATPVPTTLPSKFQAAALSDPNTPFGFRLASSAEVASIPGVTQNTSSVPSLDEGLGRGGEKQSVEIALLDTAPTPDAIKKAYDNWSGEHPLIASLLGPDGSLRSGQLSVTYASAMPNSAPLFEALENMLDDKLSYGVLDHVYDMSDHGLFAAGIAHTLAPEASLHLVEVLNHWGIGSTETLALGLHRLLNAEREAGTKLIINCSLTIQLPWDRGHARKDLPPFLLNILGTKTARRASYIDRVMLPIQWIFEAFQLKYPDVLVVAAAGNDGKLGNLKRPLARYPAALPGVIGAGALQTDFMFTSYSNQSDIPLNDGIATFGGEVDATGRADAANGMLGIYIGDFPNPDGSTSASQNGWGRWAGTSFAAPVISGVLAARIGASGMPSAARDWMEDLLIEANGKDNIFPMKQGL